MKDDSHSYGKLSRIDYPLVEEDSHVPPLTAEAVRTEARAELMAIRDFVTTDAFIRLLGALYDRGPAERDAFVRDVLLDEQQLHTRGITVPAGVKIQRSQFVTIQPPAWQVVLV